MEDYGLYMAYVEGVAVASDLFKDDVRADSRLTVRILPHMKGIDRDMLPKYPPFFKDEMVSGKQGELVWVVCSSDFSVGYVLGNANYNTYQNMYFDKFTDNGSTINASINTDMKRAIRSSWLDMFGLDAPDFADMKVTYWSDSTIHFVNKNNGGSYIMYSNGNLHVMEPNRFTVRIGSNVFSMDKNGIELACKGDGTIAIQSEDVALGMQPSGKALATAGDGETTLPSSYVRL